MKMCLQFLYIFLMLYIPLKGMETIVPTLEKAIFIDITDKYPSLSLQRIEINNLKQEEEQFLIELVDNYSDLKEIFGSTAAVIIKSICLISPHLVFEMMKQSWNNRMAKMADGQRYGYHWIVQDLSTKKYMGYISVGTYVDDIPDEYADKLCMELGAMIHPNYRDKGFAANFAHPILKWLQQFPPFNNAIFCFNTLSSQKRVQKLAQKMQCLHAASRPYEIDFGLYKQSMTCDLFIMPTDIK